MLGSHKVWPCSHDTSSLIISSVASEILDVLQNSPHFRLIVNVGVVSFLKNVWK